MDSFFHSVALEEAKCIGCTTCIKRCPTEAIRVREGKAEINSKRCIDCGECIRVCPKHAKRAHSTKLAERDRWKYRIALPAPALFGQFNNLDDIDIVLNGLKAIGFDDVFEVSRGAELVSSATRKLMRQGKLKAPVISSACPAVVRLIRLRFPNLVEHVLPLRAPMEVSAYLAKQKASEKTGIPVEEIGVFFITPCPAKVTDLVQPIGFDKSWADGAIAVSKIFPQLSDAMGKLETIDSIAKSGLIGVSWASSGGEASATLNEKYLAADGIENVINVLEELEDERIRELEFIELNACAGGCVGGVLCVENAYVAQARIHRLRKYLPVSQNHLDDGIPDNMLWTDELEFSPVMKLSADLGKAMQMLSDMEDIRERLPGLDCGSCGAPTCKAFAEDIVKGRSKETDCIFILRKQVLNMANALSSMGGYVPETSEEKGESFS